MHEHPEYDVIMTKPDLNTLYILTACTKTKVKVGRFVCQFAFAFRPNQDSTPRTIWDHPICPSDPFTNRGIYGVKSRWDGDFPHRSRPALGLSRSPPQREPGLFPEGAVKRPRRGVYHLRSSSAEVKERVELYLYSPSGPSWPVLG
jgi:hypothetical protein